MAAVTVVITSCNQGRLIREAVESALTQTVHPERIITVDDGSDDQASVNVLSAILDDCRHGVLDTGGVAVDLIGQVMPVLPPRAIVVSPLPRRRS